jgi:glycosyltransferase involved in cell wall biosynthesis
MGYHSSGGAEIDTSKKFAPYNKGSKLAGRVLMCATSAPGGISQLVTNFQTSGFTARWRVEHIASHLPGTKSKRVVAAAVALGRVIRAVASGDVALLHLHASMRGSFWRKAIFLAVGRLGGRAVIFHLHGSEFKEFFENECGRVLRCLVRLVLSRASAVVVLSQGWGEYVRGIAPLSSVEVISNFTFAPATPAEHRGSNRRELTCLFLGLLGPRKGVADLLQAVWQLRGEGLPVRLHVGGNGDVRWFKGLVSSLALDDCIVFHGWVGGDQKWTLLREADVFVLPSYNEAQPVAIVEAMAVGCPVISTTIGGIPEMLADGEAGILIDPGDVTELVRHLRELALNRDLRDRVGQAGRIQFEQRFSPEAVLPLWTALYERYVQ